MRGRAVAVKDASELGQQVTSGPGRSIANPPAPPSHPQTTGRVHSPPPPPSRELLAARERKGQSVRAAGRTGGCVERGGGGCLLHLQALGTGSSLRHEQIRGRWKGLGLPLPRRSNGPGVCVVVSEGQ